MHFLEKWIFLDNLIFLLLNFFCRDRGRKDLSRSICEMQGICAGIAITNEITKKQIFHTQRLYVVNDITVIDKGIYLCAYLYVQVHISMYLSFIFVF